MSQTGNFVPKVRPEGIKCAQLFDVQIVWFYMLNTLKQKVFEKSISMMPIFELEKAPKN